VSAPGRLASAVGRDLPLSAAIREAANVYFPSARFVGNIREKRAVRRKSALRFLSWRLQEQHGFVPAGAWLRLQVPEIVSGPWIPHLINKKSPVWRPIIRSQS